MPTERISREHIVSDLRSLGLTAGDIVLLHSSLSSIGHVEGGAVTVVRAFMDVLGEEGTLVVPTFGSLGAVTEVVRDDRHAVRSVHPKACVAAIGAKAEEICCDHWKAELAHGHDTPYTRIAELGGYVCLLGVDQDRNTTLHSIEELQRLAYLKPITAESFQTPEGVMTKTWPYFPGPHRNFIGLDRMLRESGKMRVGKIGSAVTRLIKSRDLIDLATDAARKDRAYVLCDNPNCADCVSQRADLRRDRLSAESFTLASAATLAGKYLPEIIDNCRAAGIDAVELDGLAGKPAHAMSARQIATAVRELDSASIRVTSVRSGVVSDTNASLMDVASASGVNRLVLPLSADAEVLLRAAAAKGVALSFYNTDVSSDRASAILQSLGQKNLRPGFTFNGANFARAGENPFLGSYKKKLRRYVDQLDLTDATADGTPQPLARGHGEVKEMISILRCASFAGPMVLSAANRTFGTLTDAAGRFEHLLDTM
jgi:aminoglycoside 3-N-acetyltransferase